MMRPVIEHLLEEDVLDAFVLDAASDLGDLLGPSGGSPRLLERARRRRDARRLHHRRDVAAEPLSGLRAVGRRLRHRRHRVISP
jgi:hypothetical protein